MISCAGENVVRPDEVQPLLAEPAGLDRARKELDGREELLVGGRAEVDNARRSLQPFILHRVEQQPVLPALDDVAHGLAAGARPAPEDNDGLVFGYEPFGLPGKLVGVRLAVRDHRLDGPAENPAGRVDLLDGEERGIDHAVLAYRHCARLRVENAHHDRLGYRRRVAYGCVAERLVTDHAGQRDDAGQGDPHGRRPPAGTRGGSRGRRCRGRGRMGVALTGSRCLDSCDLRGGGRDGDDDRERHASGDSHE